MAAIALVAATGCQEDWEDAFSKNVVAPTLVNNGSILMTQNTMSEQVSWAWSAARFLDGDITYSLYAQYDEATPVQIGASTDKLTLSLPKTQLYTLLKGISGVPENDSFNVKFYVQATNGEVTCKSETQDVTIYAYGDAISPVITLGSSSLVLDVTDPEGEVALLTWEPARLTYNEAITYGVFLSYNNGDLVKVADGLQATSYNTTVDELNELVVSAGAPEAAAADIDFQVFAYSDTYPNGVPSESAKMNITTYVATYAEIVSLPGDYQSGTIWQPGTAPTLSLSSSTKGLYAGFVDLTSASGGNVEFKFAPDCAWGADYGIANITVSDAKGYNVVKGSGTTTANIAVPSGFYHILLNKKLNTLEMVQINSIGMIGGFNSWASDLEMTYDAASHTYSGVGTFTKGDEYKFRANGAWDYSIGDKNVLMDGGGNLTFEKESGEYKVILNVESHPYTVTFLSTSMPTDPYIYVPGNQQGWSPATAPALIIDADKGIYTGYSNLNGDFKFTRVRAWEDGQEYNGDHFSSYVGGVAAASSDPKSNLSQPTAGFYQIVADIMNGQLTTTLITSWGLIGPATPNGWNAPDTDMTWNEADLSWEYTGNLTAGEFKFRANEEWGINLGGNSFSDLVEDGKNLNIPEDGNYTIKLYATRSTSNKIYCTVTKN